MLGAAETGGFALLPVYGLRIGFEPDSAAFLVSVLALGTMAFQIPIGLLSDRIDRRFMLLAAGLAGIVGAALIPFAAGHGWAFYATLFVWSGLIGTLYTVGLAHLGGRFTGADLAGANAAFVILYNAGLALGPPVVGGGMDLFPPHGFAWSLAAFFAFYTAVVIGGWGASGGSVSVLNPSLLNRRWRSVRNRIAEFAVRYGWLAISPPRTARMSGLRPSRSSKLRLPIAKNGQCL